MRTSGPGNSAGCAFPDGPGARPPRCGRRGGGFTLLELLVVVAIIAFATAGVSFALRDTASVQLEREAQRLSAMLESARVQSRATGLAVRWYPVEGGFRFDGLVPAQAAQNTGWLSPATQVQGSVTLVLGPEPIIGAQSVVLVSSEQPERSLRIATDGLRPFAVSRDGSP